MVKRYLFTYEVKVLLIHIRASPVLSQHTEKEGCGEAGEGSTVKKTKPEDVPQWVEGLPSLHKVLGSVSGIRDNRRDGGCLEPKHPGSRGRDIASSRLSEQKLFLSSILK